MQTQLKTAKAFLSLLLVIFMMYSVTAVGVSAYAETERIYSIPDVLYNSSASDISAKSGTDELKEYLRKELIKCSAVIDMSAYNIKQSDIKGFASIIYDDCPELFHVSSLSYSLSYGTIKYLYPVYSCTAAEYTAMYNQCISSSQKILSGIKDNTSLSDVQKALLIHDRLAVLCEYDSENLELGTVPEKSYTMYGALVDGIAVCQGYSEAYLYLLDQVGITSYLCESDSLYHAWNIVVIGGNEYHVDVTWDDPVNDITGRVKHTNFLRSSKGIYSTGHYANDYITTPVSTTYDNYFWQDSNAEFQLLNGEIYYIDSKNSQIKKYSDKASVKSVSDIWFAGSGGVYYPGNFSRLSSDGENLYYNSSSSVFRYNPATGTETKIWTPTHQEEYFRIYGFKYADNYLYCDLYNSPNFTLTTKDLYQQTKYYKSEESRVLTGISINTYPDETEYDIDEIYSLTGLSIRLSFSDFSSSVITDGFTVSGADTSTEGVKTVTVSYGGFSTTFTITVACEHRAKTAYSAVESTCTVQGHGAYSVCNICHITVEGSDALLPLAAHTYGENVDSLYLVSAANCTEPALYRKSCNVCGLSCDEFFSYGSATGHSWIDATCTTKKTCSVCYVTEGDVLGHNYTSVVTTPPTCIDAGMKTFSCSRCSDSYTLAVDATGHTPEVIPGKAATESQTGLTDGLKCSICDEIIKAQEIIPATGHTIITIPGKAPTCTATGLTEGKECITCGNIVLAQQIIPATGHTVEIIPGKDATETQTGLTDGEKCSVCGTVTKQQVEIPVLPPVHNHDYVQVVTKPTCTQQGYTTFTCSCGDEYIDNYVSEAGHVVKSVTVASTCTVAGEKYDICKICGVKVNTEILSLAPHTPEIIPGKEATDTESGLTDGEKCSVCGEITKKQETIPAKGHLVITVSGISPTCTETGLTEGKNCITCGNIVVAQQIIPATGHTVVVIHGKEATDTEPGLTDGEKCSVCGEITKNQEIIPAKGHTIKTISGKAPTCTETGLTEGKECITCGNIVLPQQIIPAKGHDITSVVTKPTCTEKGFTVHTCSVCDYSYTNNENKATGHKSGEWKVAIAPQAGKTGLETQNCTVCGGKLAEREIPALEAVSDKLEVKDDTVKVDIGEKITTIRVKSKVESIAKAIKNEKFAIVDKDGKEFASDEYVGTGSLIQIMDNSGKVINTYTVVVPNDVDGNGKTTAADARLALRGSAKLEKIEGVYALASDVTGDNKITAADARKILRISAGLEKP